MVKKILVTTIVLLVIVSGTVFATEGYFNAKVGIDFNGKFTESISSVSVDLNTKSGFTIAGEYLIPYKNKIELGAGVAYQLPRGFDESGVSDKEKFNFIPLYGVVKYNLDKAYLTGHIGFNMFSGTDEFTASGDYKLNGGLYYAIGGGMDLGEKLFAEVLYSVNNGKVENTLSSTTLDIRNSQLSIMIGYTF